MVNPPFGCRNEFVLTQSAEVPPMNVTPAAAVLFALVVVFLLLISSVIRSN